MRHVNRVFTNPVLGTVACVLASRWAARGARAWTFAALLGATAATVYVVGGSRFEYACGPHYVPGSVAGATTLGCLENPWSAAALAIAAALAAAGLVVAFIGWRGHRRGARESPPTAASTPPARP